MSEGKRKERRRDYMQSYQTQSPDFAPLNTASGPAEIENTEKVKGTPIIDEATDQLDATEGGNFKDLRKAINSSDNPAQQQRLQNRLNKLELKKGFKASELKAKGEKQIAKMKYGRKGAEAGMERERIGEETAAADKAATDLYQTEKKKQLKTVPLNLSGKSPSLAALETKLQGISQNLDYKKIAGKYETAKKKERLDKVHAGVTKDLKGVKHGEGSFVQPKGVTKGMRTPDSKIYESTQYHAKTGKHGGWGSGGRARVTTGSGTKGDYIPGAIQTLKAVDLSKEAGTSYTKRTTGQPKLRELKKDK